MSTAKPRTLAQTIAAMQVFTHPDPVKAAKPDALAFLWVDYVDGRLRLRALNGQYLAEYYSERFRDGRHRGGDLADHEVALSPGGYYAADLAKRVSLMRHDMIAPAAQPHQMTVDVDRVLKGSLADAKLPGAGVRTLTFSATLVADAMTASTKIFRDKLTPTTLCVPVDNLSPLRFVAKDDTGGLVVIVMPIRMGA